MAHTIPQVGNSYQANPATTTVVGVSAGAVLACGGTLDAAGTVTGVTVGGVAVPAGQIHNWTSTGGKYGFDFYALNVAAGNKNIVVTTTGAGVRLRWAEFAGFTGGGALDQRAHQDNASSSNIDAIATTLSAAEGLFVVAVNDAGFGNHQGAGWTIDVDGDVTTAVTRLVAATGTYGAAAMTMGAATTSAATILTFKDGVNGPTANFTASMSNKTVTVTDTSTAGTNPITSRSYDYGDGTAPTASTTHTYANRGAYTIIQTVSDGVTTPATHSVNVITRTRVLYTVTPIIRGLEGYDLRGYVNRFDA